MKNTTLHTTKVLGLALCLATLPVLTVVTGCAGDRYHESTGESIDDSGTTMRVRKHALGEDAEYKYSDVKVTTFKGTVQLSGFVDTSAQKSRAADIAKNVEGVKAMLENNINCQRLIHFCLFPHGRRVDLLRPPLFFHATRHILFPNPSSRRKVCRG